MSLKYSEKFQLSTVLGLPLKVIRTTEIGVLDKVSFFRRCGLTIYLRYWSTF